MKKAREFLQALTLAIEPMQGCGHALTLDASGDLNVLIRRPSGFFQLVLEDADFDRQTDALVGEVCALLSEREATVPACR